MKSTCSGCFKGHEYRLIDAGGALAVEIWPEHPACSCSELWELVSSNNSLSNMSLIQKFQESMLPEPEKTFHKAQITDEQGMPTEDGMKLFIAWQMKEHGATFKKDVVDLLLAEEKKACKK